MENVVYSISEKGDFISITEDKKWTKDKIKKVVGIYGGRFQPFGPHHLKTFRWLEKQVDVAYITTSNIKRLPKHPMNFKEKVRHMVKMGVPANKIIFEKSPYRAASTLKKFDPDRSDVSIGAHEQHLTAMLPHDLTETIINWRHPFTT